MIVFTDHDIQLLVDELDEHAQSLRAHGLRLETVAPDASYSMLLIAHQL